MPTDNTSQVGSSQVGDLWIGAAGSGQSISVSAGGEILISRGAGAIILAGQVLGAGNGAWRGGEILISGGTTGALLKATDRNVTVFIAGVDRTDYIGIGIKRTWQVGASGSNCQFPIYCRDLPDYRPNRKDEVVIFEGTDRFFCGFIDSYTDTVQRVSPGIGQNGITLQVTAVTYGAMLDRRFIGRHYIRPYAFLANIVLYDLISKNFADLGMTWGGSSGDAGSNIGEPVFNWDSGNAAIQKICDMNAWQYLVTMDKRVVAFPRGSGTGAAPFALDDNEDKWLSIDAKRNFGPYANSILVRNSQDLQALWTDTFQGDGSTPIFATSSDLSAKPVIRVRYGGGDPVAQRVVDAGSFSHPWDWYWLPFVVGQNPAATPLGPTDILEVIYPSPLSYRWLAEDADEIAAHGRFQYLQEVQNVTDRVIGQQIADGLLERMKADATDLVVVTDKKGLAPGQLWAMNTLKPPYNDTFLIEQIDSEEIDGVFFRHSVKASNAQLSRSTSSVAFVQKLLAAAAQPKDRITYKIAFTLAETIQGITNPGLAVGVPSGAVRQAEKPGIARDCALFFNSSQTTPTTADCVIDMKQNGVSIFPVGNPAKAVWPAGATLAQNVFVFRTDPLDIKQGDLFTLEILEADAAATDGTIELTVIG